MSAPAIQSNRYIQSPCSCGELTLRAFRKYHWLEVAALTAVACLIILASLAFSQSGTFAHSNNSIFFGFSCLCIAGGVLGGELIYKAILCCKFKYKTEQLHVDENTKPLLDSSLLSPLTKG